MSLYYGYSGHPNVVKLTEDPIWTLDKYWNEFDNFDQRGYDYLMSRHPL